MAASEFIYVANWKMNFTCTQASSFVTSHYADLVTLATTNTLILCPSYEALYPIAQHINKSLIKLGAQNCSPHHSGAYTGQVSAESLRDIGCTYCIVGHSEQRLYCHIADDDATIAAQVEQLILNKIIPIICIGETEQEYKAGTTQQVLGQQLDLITDVLNRYNQNSGPVYIAYEPIWSIGTGIVPEISYLKDVFSWLNTLCAELTTQVDYRFLYGGSVNEDNAATLKVVPHVGGLLMGNASLDFKKIKNIVSCDILKHTI